MKLTLKILVNIIIKLINKDKKDNIFNNSFESMFNLQKTNKIIRGNK